MNRGDYGPGDRRIDYFRMLTPAEQAEAIKRLARSGLGPYDISAATTLSVATVRAILGERPPVPP